MDYLELFFRVRDRFMVLTVVKLPNLLVTLWQNLLFNSGFHLLLLIVFFLNLVVLVHMFLHFLWTVVWVFLLYFLENFCLLLLFFCQKVLKILLVLQMNRLFVVHWGKEVLYFLNFGIFSFIVLFPELGALLVLLL